MKVSVKRYQVLEINKVLENITGDCSIKFRYFISRNKSILKSEVESINSAIETKIAGFKEFSEKQTTFLKEAIEFNSEGQPVTINNNYQIKPEKAIEFREKMQALEVEYKDALEERSKEVVEHNKFLGENCEIEVYQVQLSEVPSTLSQNQFDVLFPLIAE